MKFIAKKQSIVKSATDAVIDTAVPMVGGGVVSSLLAPKWSLLVGVSLIVLGEHFDNRIVKDVGIGSVFGAAIANQTKGSGTSGLGEYDFASGVEGFADNAKGYFSAFTNIIKPATQATIPATTKGFGELTFAAGTEPQFAAGYENWQAAGSIGALGNLGEGTQRKMAV